MKVFLLLLLVVPSASAQTDSTQVKNDSITWNKELEDVTVKASTTQTVVTSVSTSPTASASSKPA